jgi:8-oxo-dGTP pyrophosphatase MutT (NUDIX family)
LVEHIDVDGAVIEVVSRAQIRAETLRHRCTYVFVLRPDGRLVVHRRAEWKSIYPGWWDLCFGGICGVGEAWLTAAERELAEEAGVSGESLHEIGSVRYEEADGRVLGRAYVVVTDAPVEAVDGEVVELDEIGLDGLDAWLAGRQVCHDSHHAVLPLLLADGVISELLS